MKVLNLRCANAHLFEGWFASEDDFSSQAERGFLTCPMCGSHGVMRLPSAPRLLVSKGRESNGAAASTEAPPALSEQEAVQVAWLRAMRDVMSKTEDVGERFPEEARRIHYGDAQERAIRGQATPAEALELRDEGIEVMSVPIPTPFKGTLQ